MSALSLVGNKHAVEQRENTVITEALRILENRMSCYGVTLMSPDDCKAFFRLKLGELSKGYGVLFLDGDRKPIRYEEFGEQMDARVLVRAAIDVEASSAVIARNQTVAASAAAIDGFRSALAPLGIQLLDYIALQGRDVVSCFERGLISR
ncbi:MAG TPA: hypothetical protein ENI94_02485 [Gammaproteobacteria bacterium]|nr:hypothetical protein [Gammaproteobacteria bacterium]